MNDCLSIGLPQNLQANLTLDTWLGWPDPSIPGNANGAGPYLVGNWTDGEVNDTRHVILVSGNKDTVSVGRGT